MNETILGNSAEPVVAERIVPPRLGGQPAFPEPGIYFGMPDDVYHSIHACSAGGIKKLSVSSMDYWADSPLNKEREDEKESRFKAMGRAYHCRICEGQAAYLGRYAVALEKSPGVVDTVKEIRAAIEAKGEKPKGSAKEPLIEQLLALDPDAKVWDRMVAAHEEANKHKTLIDSQLYRRIEIAWAMIIGDPQLGKAFTGGHAEVSIFWYDEATGAPMKARLDYLKMNHLIDLKSFSNSQGKPVQRAIDMAISNMKYYIPVVVYLEAIAAAKKLIKGAPKFKHPVFEGAVNASGEWCHRLADPKLIAWCWTWAHQPEPEVLFVFQQTGKAPVTRGRVMHKGTTFTINDHAVQFLKRKWVRCAKAYGVDPWVDFEPVVATRDEELTWAATDFGDTA